MPDNVSGVRAAVRNAQRKLPKPNRVTDPEIGRPRTIDGEDVQPGGWHPVDIFGLPPDCPVEPLGMDGDILYLMDVMGQLAAVGPSAMGQKFIQRLFGDRQKYLYWAWPRHSAQGIVTAWRAEKVAEALYTAAAKRGLFSAADKVRGRGAWRDKLGNLIYHSGDTLWRADPKTRRIKEADTGFIEGHFYPRRPNIAAPWPEPVTHETEGNPVRLLFQALKTWNWERPKVDPVLCLGLIASAFLGGALPWRPTGFLVGDKATGKSSLQALIKAVLGDAIIKSADTTAAGIYQRIGQDSLAVSVDEIEAEADSRKTMAVIKLARLAASGDMMLRGGQDHVGAEFRAQSTFIFSAINPPPLMPQDVSRMAMLRLKKLDDELSLADAPTIDEDTAGPMLLRRLLDEWSRFDAAFKAYREVLHAGGHDGRGQHTLGVLLACADLALGPELADELGIPMVDDLSPWADWLKADEDKAENWSNCLKHLLTSRVEAWRGGTRSTIGALIDELRDAYKRNDTGPEAMTIRRANDLLAQAGVRVALNSIYDPDVETGWALCIPNESQLVAQQFRDTIWQGAPSASVWKSALRQGPAHVIVTDSKLNRVRINGVQERCTIVRLRAFEEEK